MDQTLLIVADLVAVALLTFALYFPRHRRRDLVVAYLTVNVGVLAVSLVLGSSTIGAGLGLGLFGVLSIIRLRSSEIEQHEVAYYFAALAIGLLGGLGASFGWLTIGLMVLVLAVLAVGDHPALFRRSRQQVLVLDRAFSDERELHDHLGTLLGARIRSARVDELDLVDDTTTVTVRFDAPRSNRADVAARRLAPPATSSGAGDPVGLDAPTAGSGRAAQYEGAGR
ncbi:hypothetical protein GCM10017608_26480 [Agromyces luteolus]|uniref:DUF4956 domain-containing protein n=1 Tax=Agromyces luteolus TaxID=88373 RepID=A0A7C9HNY2_9MICO|nr:DUF4956 domain-containing protein [Agromyces luteolus]MUN09024.1 DUF4956 domain-containing protein [Agromyces luteolus]GLK28713.1 hypothetical protein GCM10017608_26480 [Agromyces luteolus]